MAEKQIKDKVKGKDKSKGKEKPMSLPELRNLMKKLQAERPMREISNPIMEKYYKKQGKIKEEKKDYEVKLDQDIKQVSKSNSLAQINIEKLRRLSSISNDPDQSTQFLVAENSNGGSSFVLRKRLSSSLAGSFSAPAGEVIFSASYRDKASFSSSSKGYWSPHLLTQALQFTPTTFYSPLIRSPWYLFSSDSNLSHTASYPILFPLYNNTNLKNFPILYSQVDAALTVPQGQSPLAGRDIIRSGSFDFTALYDGLLVDNQDNELDLEAELEKTNAKNQVNDRNIEENLPNDYYFYPGSRQFYWLLANEPKTFHQLSSSDSSLFSPAFPNKTYSISFNPENIIGETPQKLDLKGWSRVKNPSVKFIEEELRRFHNNLLPETSSDDLSLDSCLLSQIPSPYMNILRQGGLEAYLYLIFQINPNVEEICLDYSSELINLNIWLIILGYYSDNKKKASVPSFFTPSVRHFSRSSFSSFHSQGMNLPTSYLDNNGSDSDGETLDETVDNTGLKSLSLKGCRIQATLGLLSSWSYLSMLTSLLNLDLSYCEDVTDYALQVIFMDSSKSSSSTSSVASVFNSRPTSGIKDPLKRKEEFLTYDSNPTTTLVNLESLSLNGNTQITSKILKFLAVKLRKKLKKLSLSCCPLLTNEGVNDIILKCTQLEELNLSFCYQISFLGLYKEKKVKLMNTVESTEKNNIEVDMIQRNLRVLNLNGLSSLVSESLNWISIALPFLEELYLEKVIKTSDSIIRNLAGSTRSLHILNITGCYQVSLDSIDFLVQYSYDRELEREHKKRDFDSLNNENKNIVLKEDSKSFTTLLLSLIDDNNYDNKKGNEMIKNKLKHLQYLDLSHNKGLKNDFFVDLTDGSEENYNDTLLTLDVSYTSVNSLGVVSFISYFQSLIHLNLSGLIHMDDLALQGVAKFASQLQVLKLNNCQRLTDQGVSAVVLSCPDLTHLSLMFYDPSEDLMNDLSGNFYSSVITSVSSGSSSALSASTCGEQYSDELLYLIIRRAKNLVHLDLSGQLRLTLKNIKKYFCFGEDSIKKKKRFLNLSLEKLNLSQCNRIHYQQISALIEILGVLNSLYLPACWFATEDPYEKKVESSLHSTLNFFLSSKNFENFGLNKRKYIKRYNENNYLLNEVEYIKKSYLNFINEKKNSIPKNFDFNSSFSYLFSMISPIQLIEKMRKLRGFHYIQPSPQVEQLKRNDSIIDFFLHLISCKNKIVKCYMSFKFYKKFREKINGRKIIKFFLYFYNKKKTNEKILELTLKNNALSIYKFIKRNYFIKKKQLFVIKRFLLSIIKQRKVDYYKRKVDYIITIQKNVRRFLFRISDKFFIFSLYKFLPPFWKQMANFELTEDGQNWGLSLSTYFDNIDRFKAKKLRLKNKKNTLDDIELEKDDPPATSGIVAKTTSTVPSASFYSTEHFYAGPPLPVVGVERYEISMIRDRIKGMLYTIENDIFSDNFKKSTSLSLYDTTSGVNGPPSFVSAFKNTSLTNFPSFPTYIPQIFDLDPYASLGDGTKISITSSGESLLNEEFISKVETKAKEVIKAEYLDYLDGYNPLYKNEKSQNLKDLVFNSNEFDPQLEKELPLHSFHNVYWPITRPLKKKIDKKYSNNTLIFDPSRDYFNKTNLYYPEEDLGDIGTSPGKGERIRDRKREILNKKNAINKTKLNHCTNCNQRIALLYCVTCNRNLCFFCLYNDHIGGPPASISKKLRENESSESKLGVFKQNNLNSRKILKFHHKIKFLYPYSHSLVSNASRGGSSVVNSSSQYSLIHYLNQSESIFFELNYLLKFLKNQAEIIRLKKEKEMLKAYEKDQEEKQATYLKMKEKFLNKINNILIIQKFYLGKKQKRSNFFNKIQYKIEEKSIESNNLISKITKFQTLYRRYHARNFLSSINFPLFYTFQPYIRKNKYGMIEHVEPIKNSDEVTRTDKENIYEEYDDVNMYNLIGLISKAKKKLITNKMISNTTSISSSSIILKAISSPGIYSLTNLNYPVKKVYKNLTEIQSIQLTNFLMAQLNDKISVERESLLYSTQQNYINLLKFTYTNINHWKKIGVKIENSLPNDHEMLQELRDELKEIMISGTAIKSPKEDLSHRSEKDKKKSHDNTMPNEGNYSLPHILLNQNKKKHKIESKDYMSKEERVKRKAFLQIKIKIVEENIRNKTNLIWWITQHLRTVVRQFQTIPYKLIKLMERLIWVEKESEAIDRVLFLSKIHIHFYLNYSQETFKKGKFKNSSDNVSIDLNNDGIRDSTSTGPSSNTASSLGDPIKWLQEKIIQCELQQVELDKYQETLLKTEIASIDKLSLKINSCCNLMEELHTTINSFNKLNEERIFIEKKIIYLTRFKTSNKHGHGHTTGSRRPSMMSRRSSMNGSFSIDDNDDDSVSIKLDVDNVEVDSPSVSKKKEIPLLTSLGHMQSLSSSSRDIPVEVNNSTNDDEEELIQFNKSLLTLRNKQKILFSNNFDDLKLVLSKSYDELDLHDVTDYFYVNDSLDIPIKNMDQIKAFPVPLHSTMSSFSSLVNSLKRSEGGGSEKKTSEKLDTIVSSSSKKTKNTNGIKNSTSSRSIIPESTNSTSKSSSLLSLPKNFNPMDDFLRIFYMQPWVASETLKDLKVKENLTDKKLKLEEFEEELKNINYSLNEIKSKEVGLENEKVELKNLLEVYLDPIETDAGNDESYDKYTERMDKIKEIKTRVNKIEIELIGNQKNYEKMKLKPPIIEKQIQILKSENKAIEKNLSDNKKKKKKLYELFFSLENNILNTLVEDVNSQISELEEEIKRKILERNKMIQLMNYYVQVLSNVTVPKEENPGEVLSSQNISSSARSTSSNKSHFRPSSTHSNRSSPVSVNEIATLSNFFITNSTVKMIDWPIFLPPILNSLVIEKNLHVLKPQSQAGLVVFAFYESYKEKLNRDYSIEKLGIRLTNLKNELSLYKNLINSYDEGKKKNSFAGQKENNDSSKPASTASIKYLANQVSLLLSSLNRQEEMKSKDLELAIRRERLAKLRNIRIESLLQQDLKRKEEERLEQLNKKDLDIGEDTFNGTQKGEATGTAATIARKIKKKTRALEDELWKLKYSNDQMMDEEEKRMARGIREKAGGTENEEKNKEEVTNNVMIAGGIKAILFTWGEEQKAAYKKQNNYLKTRGLPYFFPLARSLGAHLNIWTETTFNTSLYITDIQLSHTDPESPLYLDLEKKYEEVLIDADKVFEMETGAEETKEASSNSNQQVYASAPPIYVKLKLHIRRSKSSSYGLQSIALSLSEEEENNLLIEGFEKLEPNLSEFNLPDGHLWVLKKSKSDKKSKRNINAIVGEVVRAKQVVEQNPENQIALDHLKKCQDKLESEIKIQSEFLGKSDPIKESIRMMALDDDEFEQWIKHFKLLDTKRASKITFDTVLKFYGLPNTDLIRQIFDTVDAFTYPGKAQAHDQNQNHFSSDELLLEFGDYMRAVSTYCFFGKEEILRFHFLYGDKDKKGYLTQPEFCQLIESINIYDKKRARKSLNILNVPINSRVTFEQFTHMSDLHPSLLNQAFLTQIELRKKSMGENWYYKKLSKYKEVRNKMASQDSMADELVKIEWERFKQDEARRARIENRKIEIENSSSEVKKAILNARQVMDELF